MANVATKIRPKKTTKKGTKKVAKKTVKKVVENEVKPDIERTTCLRDATDATGEPELIRAKKERLQRLDEYVDQIRARSSDIGASYWDIGHALNRIKSETLWHAYGSDTLKDLIKEKFTFTYQTARNMMLVAECVNREQAKKAGPMVSLAIAKSSENGCRDEVVKMIEDKVSVRKILEFAKSKNPNPNYANTRKPRTPILNPNDKSTGKIKKVNKGIVNSTNLDSDAGTYEIEKPEWTGQTGTVDLTATKKRTIWKTKFSIVNGPVVTIEIDYKKKVCSYIVK